MVTAIQQHRCEVWASNLLFLTFAVSLVADYRLGCGYFAAHKSQAAYGMLYLGNPILLATYYYIRRGLRGAKTLFLTLYAFVLFNLMTGGLSPTSYDTPFELGNLLVQHGLQVAACLLLLASLREPEGAGAPMAPEHHA